MAHKNLLLAWLNDAHALERALMPILENHARDLKDYPLLAERVRQHLEETRRHAEMVESCIKRMGESPSAIKTGMGSVMGKLQSVATGAYRDELVRNFVSDYAAEHTEIGSYRAIIAGARELGEEETATTCEQILRDEEAMASWLLENLPTVVHTAVQAQRKAA